MHERRRTAAAGRGMTNRAFIDRCLTGDVRAFERLVTRHYRPGVCVRGPHGGPRTRPKTWPRTCFCGCTGRCPHTAARRLHHVAVSHHAQRVPRLPAAAAARAAALYFDSGEADADGRACPPAEERRRTRMAQRTRRWSCTKRCTKRWPALVGQAPGGAGAPRHARLSLRRDQRHRRVLAGDRAVAAAYARRALKKILRESGRNEFEAFFQETRRRKGAAGGAPPA